MLRELKTLLLVHGREKWGRLIFYTDPYYLEASLNVPRYTMVNNHCLPVVSLDDCSSIEKLQWFFSICMDKSIAEILQMAIVEEDRYVQNFLTCDTPSVSVLKNPKAVLVCIV